MLPQNTLSHAHKMKLRWFVTLSSLPLLGVVTAFGIMPQNDLLSHPQQAVIENITLPVAAPAPAVTTSFWRNDRVQRGDTVAELLRRLSVDDQGASDFLRKDKSAEGFRRLSVGREVQSETDQNGALLALRYLDGTNQVIIERNGASFRLRTLPAQTEKRVQVRTGEITSNLYAATDAAGLPDPAANQLSDIFGGDIDFHHDLRKGDKFTVIYEVNYLNGEAVRTGRILSAEFINRGHVFRAAYFQTSETSGDYYAPDGQSMRKAFLRSPLDYSRVSSGFSLSRFHPILNLWRSHKGTDFAAPMGARVKVTCDGTVDFVGVKGGYGNVIMVNHQGNHYTTVYGHLSRFASGLHRGEHVTQGQVIGYVGMTGLATGPHLHYEFRVDGVQHDPLKVALPDGKPINEEQKRAFASATDPLFSQIDSFHNTHIARLD